MVVPTVEPQPQPQPQMRAVLARLAQVRQGSPHRYSLPFAQARAQLLKERTPWLVDGPPCTSTDISVRAEGREVGLRVTRPPHCRPDRLLVYLHGGGWCVGSPQTHDNIVRRLATDLACEAWSVDYALAPEAVFPQGLLEVRSVIAQARRDHPEAHLTVAGDSAGANLALAAALMELHASGRPGMDALMLFYGVYDEGFDDASMQAFGDGQYGLSVQAQRRYAQAYLGDTPSSGLERRCSFPLTSGVSLKGLPPTWMAIAELDILRDQNRRMAAQLKRSDVDVEVHEVPGVTHGFLSYGLMLDAAVQTLSAAALWAQTQTLLKR